MHIYLCEVCHKALLGDLSVALFRDESSTYPGTKN